MIQRESHFEYLATLAVAGQISDTEMEELAEHTAGCSSCSQRIAEMEFTSLQLFLTLAPQIKKRRISSRMQERFLIRAAYSGARMAAPSSSFRHSNFLHLAALLVAICLVTGLSWKRITQTPSRRSFDGTAPVTIAAPVELPAMADSGPVPSEPPVAGRSINGPTRRSHHASSKASILPLPGTHEESRIAAQPLFRLDAALFSSQSAAVSAEPKLSHFKDIAAGNFSPRGVGLGPSFFTSAIWSSKASSTPDQRVFHYSATLASISLQDDQAVFGLKPRMRDLSFSNTLSLIHPR